MTSYNVIAICAILTLVPTGIAFGEDISSEKEQPATIAQRLFAKIKAPTGSENDIELSRLRSQYRLLEVEVKRIVKENVKIEKIPYNSPLYCACIIASEWHMVSSEDALLQIISTPLDPKSLPEGLSMSGEVCYPAAYALAYLRVSSEKLLAKAAKAKSGELPIYAWVLVKTQKRQSTLSLIANRISADSNENSENLKKIKEIIDKNKDDDDILPSVFNNTDNDSKKEAKKE